MLGRTDNRPILPGVHIHDLIAGLSAALDLISPIVVDHHVRTGFIAARLGRHMQLPPEDVADLIHAGLLHDVGAFSLKTRIDTLAFETDNITHSTAGWALLKDFAPFDELSRIIRWHHRRHNQALAEQETPRVLRLAGLIHVADRIDVLLRTQDKSCPSPEALRERLADSAGTMFDPQAAAAAEDLLCATPLAEDIEAGAQDLLAELAPLAAARNRQLNTPELVAFSELFAQVIDFRSRFTATHSHGVAATATHLAELAGLPPEDALLLLVAGNLHDVGKLAVSTELLEKKTPLVDGEFTAIRLHAAFSRDILCRIPGLELAGRWAAQHHERLDGSGYPDGVDENTLDTGARIIAVADVFTALTEDRPYRAGMSQGEAADVLRGMARQRALDGDVADLLLDNYTGANARRAAAQQKALRQFTDFYARCAG